MSQSFNMSSIQIDTKSLELIIHHQFDNIKLSFFVSQMKRSFFTQFIIDFLDKRWICESDTDLWENQHILK